MERLKVGNDEKLTELSRKFHTFIALFAIKFLRMVLPQRGLNNLYGCPLVSLSASLHVMVVAFHGRYSALRLFSPASCRPMLSIQHLRARPGGRVDLGVQFSHCFRNLSSDILFTCSNQSNYLSSCCSIYCTKPLTPN